MATAGILIGFDASGHVAEETKNASITAARGIFWSTVCVGVGLKKNEVRNSKCGIHGDSRQTAQNKKRIIGLDSTRRVTLRKKLRMPLSLLLAVSSGVPSPVGSAHKCVGVGLKKNEVRNSKCGIHGDSRQTAQNKKRDSTRRVTLRKKLRMPLSLLLAVSSGVPSPVGSVRIQSECQR
jgi:tRNA G37 N-methylase Trm5